MTDPNIRYFTRIKGWLSDGRGGTKPGGVAVVEGWVGLETALAAGERAGILMKDREHVTVEQLCEQVVPIKWQGTDLYMQVQNGPNFIKLDDDPDNEVVTLSDAWGDFNATYLYDKHGGQAGARRHAEETATMLAESRKVEWGSNFQDVR